MPFKCQMHTVYRIGMLRQAWLQALKTRIAREPPWKTACSLVSAYFQQNLLEDFYRRQNDIIDSLMEVSLPVSAQTSFTACLGLW